MSKTFNAKTCNLSDAASYPHADGLSKVCLVFQTFQANVEYSDTDTSEFRINNIQNLQTKDRIL